MDPLPRHYCSLGAGPPIVVVGGGVIGLAIARELAREGWAVTVVERGQPGAEASRAAAGMIAPRVEFKHGSWLWNAGLESRRLYPRFAAELEDETGISIDLRLSGLLVPIFSEEDETRYEPFDSDRLSAREARELEPSLTESLRGALLYPEDGSVDNRALIEALLASLQARRVRLLTNTAALEVLVDSDRVCGVSTSRGVIEACAVVNSAGAWAGDLKVPGIDLKMRPVKGHMISVQTKALRGRPLPVRVLYSHTSYLVPRGDGRVVIGTTVEDKGFDKTVETGQIAHLIERARQVWPDVVQTQFVEAWTGLRPLGPEIEPRIGAAGPMGYVVAIGHYRNGILLSPLTALRVADALSGSLARP